MIIMENEKQIEQYLNEIKDICDNISREDIDKAIENGAAFIVCHNVG